MEHFPYRSLAARLAFIVLVYTLHSNWTMWKGFMFVEGWVVRIIKDLGTHRSCWEARKGPEPRQLGRLYSLTFLKALLHLPDCFHLSLSVCSYVILTSPQPWCCMTMYLRHLTTNGIFPWWQIPSSGGSSFLSWKQSWGSGLWTLGQCDQLWLGAVRFPLPQIVCGLRQNAFEQGHSFCWHVETSF